MAKLALAAIDLGASSGRAVLGRFDGSRLEVQEVHRFENDPVRVGDALYWDVLGLWREVERGLHAAAAAGGAIESVGVDTWGVDFGLLAADGTLLENPRHYRDPRTEGILEVALKQVPRDEIFAATGLQFLPFSTLFQLLAMQRAGSSVLKTADRLLMMPDLFHLFMTGQATNELTNSTTTQFWDPRRGRWSNELLERFDLPTHLTSEPIPAGTVIGPLRPHLASGAGLGDTKVVAPATHDTASAVAAVPAHSQDGQRPDWCYISSGTWSLLGTEWPEPVVTDACRARNFTNEGGVAGTTRLLKNIAGLWLVQECRREWARQGRDYSFEQLAARAAQAQPLTSVIDPDAADFLAPGDMAEAIRAYCRRHGEPVPADEGAIIRCAVESIALKSRVVLSWLEELVGREFSTIHMVGGGTQNKALCQATADACGRPVVAGPVEATSIGNLMVQAISAGAVGSLAQAREVVRRSFELVEYEPRETAGWDEAAARLKAQEARE